jgi:DNA polymerase-3 subunit epsilon
MYDNSRDDMFELDHQSAITWARTVLLDRNNLVILDTETTGLDEYAEIVQIGMIDGNGNTLINSFVKPLRGTQPETRKVNGITDEMVADAPFFNMLYPQVKSHIEGKRLVIYNANYDMRMMNQALGERVVLLNTTIECAMEQYAKYVGEWNDYRCSYRWQKLPSGDHSAIGDCLATLKIIQKMADTEIQ